MTKHFRNYVDKVLADNGIGENEEFVTSDEYFGILKWESGTMYRVDTGNTVSVNMIARVLEETDIKPLYEFKKINQLEAMIEIEAGANDIYIFNDEYKKIKLINTGMYLRIYENTIKTRYITRKVIDFLNMEFYKKVKNDN